LISSSSKNTDSDYLSEHIETQLNAGNSNMYLVDKPQWEVLPKEMFSSERFYITVGDRYKRGFVIPKENEDEQHIEEYKNSGYRVLAVPKDFRTNFLADYDIALRDIAGISVTGAMGFITQDAITPNVTSSRKNPFFEDIIVTGIRDNDTLENHFHADVVDKHIKSLPMNVHIDFAEVSDRIGISGVVQDGMKNVLDLDTERRVMLPFYRQVFQVGIEAPSGDRMSFQKVINFIVWLRRSGFNINIVSTDQYQSSYVRETLSQQGFAVEKVSVDASEDPYIGLRNLLQDQRLELIKNQKQEDELVKLQRLNKRIDHPQNGSKDLSDALCGACWTHIQHQDQIRPSVNNMANVISSVNGRPTSPKSRLPSVFGSYTRR
jgi:RNase P/RNase MRP subunit p29